MEKQDLHSIIDQIENARPERLAIVHPTTGRVLEIIVVDGSFEIPVWMRERYKYYDEFGQEQTTRPRFQPVPADERQAEIGGRHAFGVFIRKEPTE